MFCFRSAELKTNSLLTITSNVVPLHLKPKVPERIYNPITAMGFSAMFTFQLDYTKVNIAGTPLP
jgi:hypothetical protein